MSDVTERLKGLDEQQMAACLIAERALGAVGEPWDVDGRQGAVDVMLTLSDGRSAAFEVTNLAPRGALETSKRLEADKNKWPLPGKWWWTIEVGSPKHLTRLKQVYEKIILLCEAQSVTSPDIIGYDPSADPDLQWLVQSSTCNMIGHPELGPEKGAHVVPLGAGGAVDDTLSGFADALSAAFDADPSIGKHFDKLENAQADERHFFIMLYTGVLPFPTFSVLMFDEPLPQEPPDLPDHISHLWLAPNYSRRVLLWSRSDGWKNIYPYSSQAAD
jgi:hypothetical protein